MKKTIAFLVMSFMIVGSSQLVNATAPKAAGEAKTEGEATEDIKGGYTDKKVNDELVTRIAVAELKKTANKKKSYIGPVELQTTVEAIEQDIFGEKLPDDVVVIVTKKALNANENEESEAAFLTGYKFNREAKARRVIVINESILKDLGNARAQAKILHELLHVAQPKEIKGLAKDLLGEKNKLGHKNIRAIEQQWITANAVTVKIGESEIKLDKPVVVIRPGNLTEEKELKAAIEKAGLAGQITVELDKGRIADDAIVIGAGVADMKNAVKVEVTPNTFNTSNISAFIIGITSAYEFTRASMMYNEHPSQELANVLLAHAQALVTDKAAIPSDPAKLVKLLLSGKLPITLIPAAAQITADWMNSHQEASRTWMGL